MELITPKIPLRGGSNTVGAEQTLLVLAFGNEYFEKAGIAWVVVRK
ncbi:MAG: hypothetical protein KKA07_03925 [Bacteroidetes bacterium]|nr:hypothetical protein [Bacteroidota bacterium]